MTEVFESIVDAVSGSNWSYLIVFAIAMIDAFFPLVPSEATAIAAGVVAGTGGLRVELVILAAALGAIAGDIAGHVGPGRNVRRPAGHRTSASLPATSSASG